MDPEQQPSALATHVVPGLPAATASVQDQATSEVVRSPGTPWVNDWDLLSPGFQRAVTPMLEVLSVFLIVGLLVKRARAFTGVVLFPLQKKEAPAVEEES